MPGTVCYLSVQPFSTVDHNGSEQKIHYMFADEGNKSSSGE